MTITTAIKEFNAMLHAKAAYDTHTQEMHAKYGHLHSDDRLTVEEAMVRMEVGKAYTTATNAYTDLVN